MQTADQWFLAVIGFAVNLAVVIFGYGRLSQRVNDEKERLDRVQQDVREVRMVVMTMLGKGIMSGSDGDD